MRKIYKNHSQLLNGLGIGYLPPETFSATESFFCQMYNEPNHVNKVDQARCLLFTKANKYFPLRTMHCDFIQCESITRVWSGSLEIVQNLVFQYHQTVGGTKRREEMFHFWWRNVRFPSFSWRWLLVSLILDARYCGAYVASLNYCAPLSVGAMVHR